MTGHNAEGTLEEAIRDSPAKAKRDVVATKINDFNRRKRLEKLAEQLGSFDKVMSLEELRRLREAE